MRLSCRLCPLVLLLAASAAGAQSAPYRPADDAEVLERLGAPRAGGDALRELRAQQRALVQTPGDLGRAADFARAAIRLGRAEADPRYYGYAEAALQPWLVQPAPPPEAQLLRATLRQQRHDFAGALADLDALLAADPGNAQARLTRALVLMVQGRPADALRDCAGLVGRASLVATATCLAEARSLDGHAALARQTLEAALAGAATAPAEERIWAQTTAAELAARRGDAAAAETAFRAALDTAAQAALHDPYLLTARADFLLAQDRAAEVLPLLADATRIDNALLRLALAEAATGDARRDAHERLLAARFAETRQRGDSVHLREEAMFELQLRHDAPRALERARQNWATQREPADARLLLEAALAARQPAAAQSVLAWIDATGIEDPALHRLAAQVGDADAAP